MALVEEKKEQENEVELGITTIGGEKDTIAKPKDVAEQALCLPFFNCIFDPYFFGIRLTGVICFILAVLCFVYGLPPAQKVESVDGVFNGYRVVNTQFG